MVPGTDLPELTLPSQIIDGPVPGHTVVTTLDVRLQELAEKALETKAKRGAIVIVEPNTGDILAMASWPTYDPNAFVPNISAEKFKALHTLLQRDTATLATDAIAKVIST